uniref:Uncharacterized protein n=1 Tax=Anopheles darlingi TaxID=43151 RepID=A0A2M4CM85_ANODA
MRPFSEKSLVCLCYLVEIAAVLLIKRDLQGFPREILEFVWVLSLIKMAYTFSAECCLKMSPFTPTFILSI